MDEAISINGIEELTEKFAALTGKEQKKEATATIFRCSGCRYVLCRSCFKAESACYYLKNIRFIMTSGVPYPIRIRKLIAFTASPLSYRSRCKCP